MCVCAYALKAMGFNKLYVKFYTCQIKSTKNFTVRITITSNLICSCWHQGLQKQFQDFLHVTLTFVLHLFVRNYVCIYASSWLDILCVNITWADWGTKLKSFQNFVRILFVQVRKAVFEVFRRCFYVFRDMYWVVYIPPNDMLNPKESISLTAHESSNYLPH